MDPEFDDVVAVEDLMALERRYAAERQQGALSRQCRFEYGWGLVRSRYREDTARGVALLSELLPETPPEEQRDVLFYLALGYYRLKVAQVTLRSAPIPCGPPKCREPPGHAPFTGPETALVGHAHSPSRTTPLIDHAPFCHAH
ncbi:mitochondrial fission 1 protein [Molothrus ater]|uniref:mitochondrial fission 1 protein n=1 Tax=Molothrus ater TaxID=84834 RepID=UPI0023E79431|nr:mitochondrial fission 1 protein [Molothrus ater]